MDYNILLGVFIFVCVLIGFVTLFMERRKFKQRLNSIPYELQTMDKAVDLGIITCDECREYESCHNVKPFVFPDFTHKCDANFTFKGAYYHYKICKIDKDEHRSENKEV